ncbi:MAG: hypothetical protein A4E57_04863 [Syntrophorhabdaceae bacterium PtaU1.Bin034]|nr:MAG: hypothetical protein A4E57_04863 [Syntrophorhabdaceae bacterium PtaU1.Bin034]
MEIACPACKKKSNGGAMCERCGCEIGILERIALAAGEELRAGRKSLINGNAPDALRYAERSWLLKKSPEAARLAFLSALAVRRFECAAKWYARVN